MIKYIITLSTLLHYITVYYYTKYIVDDLEISSDSHEKNYNKENSDQKILEKIQIKKNSDEEDSSKEGSSEEDSSQGNSDEKK